MAAPYKTHGKNQGFTLLEVLITLAIVSLVMLGLGRVMGQALQTREAMLGRQELTRQAQFAMTRMTRAMRGTTRLLLPLDENPATAWSESVRDPGVLAVTLSPAIDRNQDGFADADNDLDGLVDEDLPPDSTRDRANGIVGIDDDNDGAVDEGGQGPSGIYSDDDEDGTFNEDRQNGIDDDLDGAVDEDMLGDMNDDGQPGIAGVDDDNDGFIDEGLMGDDDEDGLMREEWLDPVVFFLIGTTLMERTPVIWDENNDTTINGLDFVENPLAENVSQFRVERLPKGAKKNTLVDITLTLGSGSDSMTLHTRTRVGGVL
jgi:prepilin-type N-terminal cleavage/methylation domain-containing protein